MQRGVTKNLVVLELFPVVVALSIWSQCFQNKRILLHTDNKGVLYAINCLSSKCNMAVRLLRHVVLSCFRGSI